MDEKTLSILHALHVLRCDQVPKDEKDLMAVVDYNCELIKLEYCRLASYIQESTRMNQLRSSEIEAAKRVLMDYLTSKKDNDELKNTVYVEPNILEPQIKIVEGGLNESGLNISLAESENKDPCGLNETGETDQSGLNESGKEEFDNSGSINTFAYGPIQIELVDRFTQNIIPINDLREYEKKYLEHSNGLYKCLGGCSVTVKVCNFQTIDNSVIIDHCRPYIYRCAMCKSKCSSLKSVDEHNCKP